MWISPFLIREKPTLKWRVDRLINIEAALYEHRFVYPKCPLWKETLSHGYSGCFHTYSWANALNWSRRVVTRNVHRLEFLG